MNESDEKFLKDLAWSEAWFPWRKKNAIFIKGDERRASEWIAITLSTLAVVISAAATVGTWRQTDLMQAQLTAAESNSGSLKMAEALVRACQTIRDGPVRARKWKIYRTEDGKPAKLPIVNGQEFRISLDQREAFANKLDQMKYDLSSTSLYLGFSSEWKIRFFEAAISQSLRSIDRAIDLLDNTRVDLDYVALRSIGEACSDDISNAVVDFIGPEGMRRSIPRPELDAFTRHLLRPIEELEDRQ